VPNMVVMAPRDEDQLRHMLATGLAHEEGPSSLRYPRGSGYGVDMSGEPTPIALGESETMATGKDVCLLAVGSMVHPALAAAELLAADGVSCEVVDMRFIKPLDEKLLTSVWQRHRVVFTVEENNLAGGFGAAVLEWSARSKSELKPSVKLLGIPDAFQEHASRAELLADLGLDAAGIAASVRPMVTASGVEDSQTQSAS